MHISQNKHGFCSSLLGLLGGPWDLVNTCNWIVTLLVSAVTPISPFRGVLIRVISPVISSY